MPTYIVTDPETGIKLRLTGDTPPTEQELEQIFSQIERDDVAVGKIPTGIAGVTADKFSQAERPPEPTIGQQMLGAGEAGLAIATGATGGALGALAGGAKGIGQEIISGKFGQGIAEEAAAEGAQALTYAPRTASGQAQTKAVGEFLGETLPPVIPVVGPAGGFASGIRQALPAVERAAGAAAEVGSGIFQYQSKTKQQIGRMILEKTGDIETAKFKLKDGQKPTPPGEDAPKIKQYLDIGGPKIVKDKAAQEAIKQGFDEAVIAAIKGASKEDRSRMLAMTKIMEGGKRNARFAVTHRATDVVGESLMRRVATVRNANLSAGRQIDGIAKGLKGKRVEFDAPVNSFLSDLDDMGIKVKKDLTLDFMGSDIEGAAGPMNVISKVFSRMKNTKVPDAYDLHRMKRFIDEQVTYGKSAEGLSGRAERVLKTLRKNIDDTLDNNFPEYNKVNSQYSETISVLDALQDVAGKKMDFMGPNADRATGTLMRRVMSNAQSRVRLLDSIKEIEQVAKKHGGKFNDDLLTQALFADELDSVFGPTARTSFQGQIGQAVERTAQAVTSPHSTVVDIAAKTAEKVRGINQENAFKSIKRLLEEQSKEEVK